jgi:general secretion pathway protein B
MSYILDALKKAESERERGVVPGLNSTQANHSTFIHYGSDQKPWWILALVLGALLIAVVALWAWRQSAADPVTALAVPSAPVVTAAAVPVQAQARTNQPPVQVKTLAPEVQKPELPARAPAPAPVPAKAGPLEASASSVAHVQAQVAPAPASAKLPAAPAPAAAVPVDAPVKPAPSAAPIRSASGGIPALSDLPDSLRRQIPALNISGAIYSDSPAEWTLIINDQVMGKGSQVAPDVRLEEISANSAVFNFKGQRFRMER